jgi:hypothetical protein
VVYKREISNEVRSCVGDSCARELKELGRCVRSATDCNLEELC